MPIEYMIVIPQLILLRLINRNNKHFGILYQFKWFLFDIITLIIVNKHVNALVEN